MSRRRAGLPGEGRLSDGAREGRTPERDGGVRMSGRHAFEHDRGAGPGVRRGPGPSTSAVDAVHDRVLGAVRLLRHPLGPRPLHRRAVPRGQSVGRGAGEPDLRRLPRARVRGGDLRRLRRRQGPRVPAIHPAGRGDHGRGALHAIAVPDARIFKFGLATIIVGNGLFKPNISTMVGKLYTQADQRRDSGFTIFYMGINAGAFLAPILTGWLADQVFGTRRDAGLQVRVHRRRASACW